MQRRRERKKKKEYNSAEDMYNFFEFKMIPEFKFIKYVTECLKL